MLSARQSILVLVLLLAGAAVYLPSLSFGFVFDDVQQVVVSQPNLTWRAVPGYFTADVWAYSGAGRTNYYRPVFLLWLMLNSQLFHLSTAFWHLGAIAAHLAAVLLLYVLVRRLARDERIAVAAALLFAVHPVHVEAVAWISGSTETLFAIFAFGAILCYLESRQQSSWIRWLGWSAACVFLFALALFAKETAIVLPLLIGVYEWLYPVSPSASAGRRLRIASLAAIQFAPVVAIYLLLRLHALGSLAPATLPWPAGSMAATWPLALSIYLRQLLLPITYTFIYPAEPVKDPGIFNFAIPLAVVCAAAAGLIWLSRRSRLNAFSAFLLLLPVLPVLNLRVFSVYDFIHDRYLYLASAGLCIMLAVAWKRIGMSSRRASMAVLITATALLAAITIRTSFYWRTNNDLFAHAIRVAPDNPLVQEFWGKHLVAKNRCAEALPMLKAALFALPDVAGLNDDIASCYVQQGDLNQAAGYLRDAIAMKPADSSACLHLGLVEFMQGRLPEAEEHVRQALRLRVRRNNAPMLATITADYHLSLGRILEAKGDLEGALAEYGAELAENPLAKGLQERIADLAARLKIPAP